MITINKSAMGDLIRSSILLSFLLLLGCLPVQGQVARISQSVLPTARITNQQDIERLLELLFIFEEEVTRMDIIDVTSNGFGPDDIVVTYPSQQTHYLGADVDGEAQAMMDQWAFEAEFRRDASSTVQPEQFDPSLNPNMAPEEQAEMAILSEILYSLRRNYNDEPVRMLFERDNGAFTFQMWDFKPPQMQHVARPAGPPDTLTTFDLLYVLASDSLIEADTAYYDILYLQRTVQDSVFIPFNEEVDLTSEREYLSPGDALRRQRRVGINAENR